ncbi:MAG: methyltransferase [Polyangiales bacterium]
MAKRTPIEGRVRAVGRGGDGVVETAAGIVLTPGCLPGERVKIEADGSRRGVSRGRLLRVTEPSERRVDARCELADRCGGCPLMIAAPSLAEEIKEGFLEHACAGLPGADDTRLQWVESGKRFGYRRRARLAWHGHTLGYRRRNSSRVLDVPTCVVLEEALQAGWEATREILGPVLAGRGEILVSRSGTRATIAIRSEDEQPPGLFAACEVLAGHSAVAGVEMRVRGGAPASWGDVTVTMRGYDDSPMLVPPGAFTQANDDVNIALVDAVVRLAAPKDERVLELHCGVGNFTMALARDAKTLVAIERDPGAVRACQANLAARSLEARVVAADANDPPKGRYDVIVLDPPRQGARTFFENHDAWIKAKRIVYVSCDTATLRRDLQLACAKGFRLDEKIAFDMFPQTAHVESVIRLVR